jgi:hypothetical protein
MGSISPSDIRGCVKLLNKNGIKLRDKDGKPRRLTLSTPISKEGNLVLGIRYEKLDRSFSEDAFLFESNGRIISLYKGRIEVLLPEYEETHKRQGDFD